MALRRRQAMHQMAITECTERTEMFRLSSLKLNEARKRSLENFPRWIGILLQPHQSHFSALLVMVINSFC